MNLIAAILLDLAPGATKRYMLFLPVGAQSFRNKHAGLAKHRIPSTVDPRVNQKGHLRAHEILTRQSRMHLKTKPAKSLQKKPS